MPSINFDVEIYDEGDPPRWYWKLLAIDGPTDFHRASSGPFPPHGPFRTEQEALEDFQQGTEKVTGQKPNLTSRGQVS
jgi:hypothetical protein